MSILIDNLSGNKTKETPVWFMRQAGRHLPEYHKLKSKYNSLLDMFLNKDAIVEATLQPLLRYEIDAAIIFSDILMVPYIMGGTPTFENSGTGPTVKIDFQEKPNFEKTQVIYDSIQEVKSKNSKPLLGFSGGAWSTLLYCLFGANERKIISQKLISEKEEQIKNNINKVTDVIILHAIKQAESGIDAFQIFESWSGLLNDEQFEEWCVEPAKKITEEIKKLNVQTIGFPRETSLNNYVKYSNIETLDCISLDTKFSLSNISKLNQNICFQGNLDPLILLGGGEELKNKAMEILTIFKNHPHIFNLGHGVLPDTKIENIITLIEAVKKK